VLTIIQNNSQNTTAQVGSELIIKVSL